MTQYERIKERLRSINIKRNKKRVTDVRLHLTQYLSHVIPLSSQRFILSPLIRASLLSQIGSYNFIKLFNIRNTTPVNIFKGTVGIYGFKGLWKGTTSHVLSGVIFPSVYMISKWISNVTYVPYYDKPKGQYLKRYLESLSICTFSHLFSYPLDTCYTRLSSDYTNCSIKKYIRHIIQQYGVRNLYSGFLLCLLSTSTHLMITLPLNQQMQYRIINSVNDEIAKNPILKSNPKSIKPKELKPVELYPFNLIFATLVSFVSKTITYPIDTLKVKYQYNTRENYGYKRFFAQIKQSGGFSVRKLYAGFSMKSVLFLPECLLYGTLYSAVVKFLS